MTPDATGVLRVAVVGHTNTGKTSLLRTLTRDPEFGEVSPSPAQTRHVEGTALLVGGRPLLELYDTPGLEDSIGLLDLLETLRGDRRVEGIEIVRQFLDSDAARARFAQEAKALRQVLAGDVALYVIDARDRVLGKHRDELEILARCARPVVPVLNFTASPDARTGVWREHLARANMHAVAEFDTVVLDELGEQRLFEKMRTLLDAHAATLDALIDDRRRHRAALVRGSAALVAELLLDVAAYVAVVPLDERDVLLAATDRMRDAVRRRERECVRDLLELHRFRPDDVDADQLPVDDGRWKVDLFHPEALRHYGIRTGGAVAAGAVAGLAIDAAAGGLTLGAGAALGAALGAAVGGLLGAARDHGRRLLDRLRRRTELRCDDATLRLLATRQTALVAALLRRGHASLDPVRVGESPAATVPAFLRGEMPASLVRARLRPAWSTLLPDGDDAAGDPSRRQAADDLTKALVAAVEAATTPAKPGTATDSARP
ncbi:MAG: GTPase/DUF3482 domain-containing protein [Planctomycetota bacterium]